MSKTLKVIGIVAAVIALFMMFTIGVVALYAISTLNKDAALRAQIHAKNEANKPSFDTMRKIISQKAQITDKYKSDFKEIWTEIISGRYNKGAGQMMAWIQEIQSLVVLFIKI